MSTSTVSVRNQMKSEVSMSTDENNNNLGSGCEDSGISMIPEIKVEASTSQIPAELMQQFASYSATNMMYPDPQSYYNTGVQSVYPPPVVPTDPSLMYYYANAFAAPATDGQIKQQNTAPVYPTYPQMPGPSFYPGYYGYPMPQGQATFPSAPWFCPQVGYPNMPDPSCCMPPVDYNALQYMNFMPPQSQPAVSEPNQLASSATPSTRCLTPGFETRRKLSFNSGSYRKQQGHNHKQFTNEVAKDSTPTYSSKQQQQSTPASGKRRVGYMHNILYKTEMCRDIADTGVCPRGKACQFAHTDTEMHDPRKHPLYKTAFCYDFKNNGFCPRGDTCFHVHEATELKVPHSKPRRNSRRSFPGRNVISVNYQGKDSPDRSASQLEDEEKTVQSPDLLEAVRFETPYRYLLKKLAVKDGSKRNSFSAFEGKTLKEENWKAEHVNTARIAQ